MTTIAAKTVLRSRNTVGPDKVISTLLCRYPQWMHADVCNILLPDVCEGPEAAGHAPSLMVCDDDLSRDAPSDEAAPFSTLIDDVLLDPAVPLFSGKDDKVKVYRRGGPSHLFDLRDPRDAWVKASHAAIECAQSFAAAGYDRQIVGRLLAPFAHVTVLISSTEWESFLDRLDHPDTDPHLLVLAQEIRTCLSRHDDIQTLPPGQWHLPFLRKQDWLDIWGTYPADSAEELIHAARTLSATRCASARYDAAGAFDVTLEQAIALHDDPVRGPTILASCEHIAQADAFIVEDDQDQCSGFGPPGWQFEEEHANFVGFRQYKQRLLANRKQSDMEPVPELENSVRGPR